MKRIIAALAVCSAAMFAQTAAAQMSVQQLIQTLQTESGPLVRSLAQSGQLSLQPQLPIPPHLDFPTVRMSVCFRPDTALLTTAGMTVLRELAFALKSDELAASTVQIGAHTAPGSAGATNALPLSTRRAQVVAEHLVAFYEVPQDRVIPVGYGQSYPVLGTTAADPQNERIEIINVDELVR